MSSTTINMLMNIPILAKFQEFHGVMQRQKVQEQPWSLDWLVILTYIGAAVCCFLAMRKEQQAQLQTYEPRAPRFWMVLGIFMSLLGLAKLIGADAMIDAFGKQVLKSEGAYAERGLTQAVLIIQAAILGVIALGVAGYFVRKIWRQYLLPIGSAIYLATFCAIRAISLHDVDQALHSSMCGIQLGAYFDLLGITLIVIAAIYAIRRDYTPKLRAYETRVRIR